MHDEGARVAWGGGPMKREPTRSDEKRCRASERERKKIHLHNVHMQHVILRILCTHHSHPRNLPVTTGGSLRWGGVSLGPAPPKGGFAGEAS